MRLWFFKLKITNDKHTTSKLVLSSSRRLEGNNAPDMMASAFDRRRESAAESNGSGLESDPLFDR